MLLSHSSLHLCLISCLGIQILENMHIFICYLYPVCIVIGIIKMKECHVIEALTINFLFAELLFFALSFLFLPSLSI